MSDGDKFDRALAAMRLAGKTEVVRQMDPTKYERNPPSFQKYQERERGSESSWAGSSMGGGVWAGRQR